MMLAPQAAVAMLCTAALLVGRASALTRGEARAHVVQVDVRSRAHPRSRLISQLVFSRTFSAQQLHHRARHVALGTKRCSHTCAQEAYAPATQHNRGEGLENFQAMSRDENALGLCCRSLA
jgi:hypothetical protein